MATKLKQIQSQKQKLAPKQVLNARLLQLNIVNLEQTILKELEQNPTLEQLDPVEEENVDLEKDNPIEDMDVSIEDMYSNESNYYLSEQKKEAPIPDQITFSENLIDQLQHINLEENEYEIAEEIIWNINERGYLDTDLILIADRYNLLEDEIVPILHKVQRLEPKGIGSRSLKECLMIQLEDQKSSLSYTILDKLFDDFMHKRYDKIKDRFKCSSDELHKVVEIISNLNPRPGEGYRDKFQTVIPDIIVREDGDDWVITTNDSGLPELRISPFYEDQVKNNKFKGEAKKFIKEKIDATKLEIDIINLSGKRHRMKLLDETVTDEQNYKDITIENLEILHSLDMSKSILLGQVHSNYFGNIDYFYVPINSIICFLSDLNFGSMDLKTGLLKYFRDASEGPKLFDDIFKYRSRLIEEEFQFNNDDIPEMSVSCFDVFKNSNWYYPGQLCPNSLFSFSGYNIGNTDDCYLYNIHLDNQSIKITNFDDYEGQESEIYTIKQLCYTNHTEYKIFIITGCMMLNIEKPEIQENILDIKKIKYFNTKINIDVEKEHFTKDDPLTNSYQYYCVTHQNYIFNYQFYSAKNLISFYETQPEEIEIYDNRNRIVNEIIEKLNSSVAIPEKYIHFLQSLSFKELQLTILNLLTSLSSAHTSIYLQTQILDRVFIKDYIERKIGVFQRYIYDFETKNYDPDVEKRAISYIKGKINDILLLESFFKNQESSEYHAKFHQMMAESLEFPEVYFIKTTIKGSITSPEKFKSMVFNRPEFHELTYSEFPKYTGLQQIIFKKSHLNVEINNIVITSFNYTLMFQSCILESVIDFQNFYSCENIEFDCVQIKDSTFMINNKFPFLKNFKFCDVKEGGLSHIIFHEQLKLAVIMIKDSDIRIVQIISNLPSLQNLHLINLPNLRLFFNSSHLSNLQILHLQQIKIPISDIRKLLNIPKLQRVILYSVSINSVSINSDFTYELLQSQVKCIMIRDTKITLDLTKVNREFKIETIQTDESVTLITPSSPWFHQKITFESL